MTEPIQSRWPVCPVEPSDLAKLVRAGKLEEAKKLLQRADHPTEVVDCLVLVFEEWERLSKLITAGEQAAAKKHATNLKVAALEKANPQSGKLAIECAEMLEAARSELQSIVNAEANGHAAGYIGKGLLTVFWDVLGIWKEEPRVYDAALPSSIAKWLADRSIPESPGCLWDYEKPIRIRKRLRVASNFT